MNFLVFDFETGGLDPAIHGPTQLAAAVVRTDPSFTYCEPVQVMAYWIERQEGLVYNPDALALSHDEEARERLEHADIGRAIEDLRAMVRHWFRKEKACSPFAHNSPFDADFMAASCERLAVDLPFNRQHVCTCQMFRALRAVGHHSCYGSSLDVVCDYFGIRIRPEDRHTARGDVMATAEAAVKMMNLFSAQGRIG